MGCNVISLSHEALFLLLPSDLFSTSVDDSSGMEPISLFYVLFRSIGTSIMQDLSA